MKKICLCMVFVVLPWIVVAQPVPDTEQTKCYDTTSEIECPLAGYFNQEHHTKQFGLLLWRHFRYVLSAGIGEITWPFFEKNEL